MIEVLKVFTLDLTRGMYVSALDRPWLESPFPLQGFRIESDADLRTLHELCEYVYVDVEKSRLDLSVLRAKVRIDRPRTPIASVFPARQLTVYEDHTEWQAEYPRAAEAVQELSSGIQDLFKRVSAGVGLDVLRVKKSVEPMIDSISRNPDACIWLARLRQADEYTYQHSLGASVWAVALGRQLGLPRADLRSLAVGGLLFDVGKLRIDPELLHSSRPLVPAERLELQRHVEYGLEIVAGGGMINADVLAMVGSHHERHDGSGYPKGLRGDAIPVFARIAAIVDCYAAITSHRSYARAVSPPQAIKLLYEWRDQHFQAELVEEFIQAIGIYPAGTLVELSTGEVAVVVAEYRTRRLRPRVMLVCDVNKQPVRDSRIIDLLHETVTSDGRPLEIVGSHEVDAFNVDLSLLSV